MTEQRHDLCIQCRSLCFIPLLCSCSCVRNPSWRLCWCLLLSSRIELTLSYLSHPPQNPFDHLYRDSDVEGMTDGFDERTAYGSIEGYQDASMGWSQYAQFYKHFNFNRCVACSSASSCRAALSHALLFYEHHLGRHLVHWL